MQVMVIFSIQVSLFKTISNIIFKENQNYRIRKIDASTGKIYTVIGTGSSAFTADGFNATSTSVYPRGLAIHPISLELYFVDIGGSTGKYLIRRVNSQDGKVYTVIGGGQSLSATSLANATNIGGVSAISFAPNGDLYFDSPSTHGIKRMIYGSNMVSTIAGLVSYMATTGDGPALSTSIAVPQCLVYWNGEVYFVDVYLIRKVSSGQVVTLAGGIGDGGLAVNSELSTVSSLALTDTDLYLSDKGNYRIRKVSFSSGLIDSVVGAYYYTDNGDNFANKTNINLVNDIRILNNQILFTDSGNNKIRKTDISGKGKVTTIAGKGTNIGIVSMPENELATQSYLNNPSSVAYLPNGEVIIADTNNNVIRKVDLIGNITLIAGKPFQAGFNGDSSNAKNSLLNNPTGLSTLKDGRIVFADTMNMRIRMLTPYCPVGYIMNQLPSGGLVCNITTCYGVSFDDSKVCSGKGTCQALNSCSCLTGYSGLDCSIADYCTLYPTSTVCSSSSFNTTESQTSIVSNITQLDSKTIQFSSTPSISISLPSIISQYLQSSEISLKNDSVQVVSSLSESKKSETAVISQVVSLVLLKSNSNEKITVQNLQQPISFSFENVTLTLPNIEKLNISCVYLDENSKEWKSDGLETEIQNQIITQQLADGNVTVTLSIKCNTNHLTSFSVIDQNYKKATSQPNKEDVAILQDNTVLIAAIVGSVGGLCVIGTIIALIVVVCIFVKRKNKK